MTSTKPTIHLDLTIEQAEAVMNALSSYADVMYDEHPKESQECLAIAASLSHEIDDHARQ